MSTDFTGRVAVVTGAGNGLGATYARTLARLGAAVVVVNDIGSSVDGTPDGSSPADTVVAEIVAAGGRAVADTGSVADPRAAAALVARAVAEFGRLDIVVNNAGNRRNASVEDITPEDFEAVLAVHLKGALYVSQAAFAVMKEQGYGRLLLTSSSAGLFGNAGQIAYAAAKAGVFGLAQAIAIEGAPLGIRANVLLPMAGTPRALAGFTAQATASMAAGGGGTEAGANDTDLVAALVTYLVSEECTATHEVFACGGGRYYSAFVGTTAGWRSTGPQLPSPDDVAAHLDLIRSRSGYTVPASLGEDVAASMRAVARTPAQAVALYFDSVRAKDADALHGLFAPDCAFEVPGTRLTGNDAVRDFYRQVFAAGTPRPTPGPLLVDGERVSVQIDLEHDGHRVGMADFFTVGGDGRIHGMRAYQS
jgi:NAD(P)-dependent dehydrogenase (short-subunit alcohol dehydrogenase family)